MNNETHNNISFKILGSGSCVPRIERAPAGNIFKYKNYKFLLDCGPGILRQLVKAKEDYKNLTGVILSHFHPDHSSDFIPLILALSATPDFERKENLYVIGPKGLSSFVENLYNTFNIRPNGFEVKCIEDDAFILNNELYIYTFKGNHTATSIVTKVVYKNNDGKSKGFVYSGDTDYDEKIAKFARNIDLLVLESSFPYKTPNHLTPELAGQIAQESGANKLVITHLFPPMDNPNINVQHRIKEHFMGQVLVAQDFMEIVI